MDFPGLNLNNNDFKNTFQSVDWNVVFKRKSFGQSYSGPENNVKTEKIKP